MSSGSRVQITSGFTDAELNDITYAQSGNVLFLAHPNHAPMQLVRNSDTSWTLSTISFVFNAMADYWYENAFIKFKIISGSTAFATTDTFTITTPAGTVATVGTPTGNGTIVGVAVKSGAPSETWTVKCISATKDRQEFTVIGGVSATPTLTWASGNYPSAVTFFEQRLWYAGSASAPQTIWGSVIGNYAVMTQGAADNDACTFTIASTNFDQLIHLESTRYLLPLSYGGEFTMQGGTSSITPTSVRIRAQTSVRVKIVVA
jgi:hypothetical protein